MFHIFVYLVGQKRALPLQTSPTRISCVSAKKGNTPIISSKSPNMSKNNPPTIRWGILATGGIAQTFAKDLLVDPKTRNVHSVVHTVVAAASSSSKSRAEQFLIDIGAPSSAKAYGSYKELVEDPHIDIIYIATPHSHHYQNAMLCLEAGKNVLCEKAFTVNAAQTKLLVKKAREKVYHPSPSTTTMS